MQAVGSLFMNNFDALRKGDVLYGRKKSNAIHPIVYLGCYDKIFLSGPC